MLIRISADGRPIFSQPFVGEDESVLTVVKKNNAYYIYAKDQEIVGVIPVICEKSKGFLIPRTEIDASGCLVSFCNVNQRLIPVEFLAIIFFKNTDESLNLPSIADVLKEIQSNSGIGNCNPQTLKSQFPENLLNRKAKSTNTLF